MKRKLLSPWSTLRKGYCDVSKCASVLKQQVERGELDSPGEDWLGANKDGDLQLSRRLDWRFLLPKPDLGCVAYVGPTRGTLLAALQRFCGSLTVIQASPGRGRSLRGDAFFDLVVVRSPGLSDLRAAVPLLRVGGYLYWEIDRPSCLYLLGTKASIGNLRDSFEEILLDHVSVAEGLRLSEVEVYWHRPSFEECLEIISLNHRPAVEFAFSQGGGLARFFTSAPGKHLVRGELLRRFLPCVSVVACKTSG